MKQLFYLMLFCASIFIVSCNKETADMTNTDGIQTQKLSANSISLSEAQASFSKAVREPQSSLTGTPLNLADFDPQWNNANLVEFVDTSGNMLTVPTNIFLPGAYKKLVFLRYNGQTTFLVATIIGTPEYIGRKNGICTMNDFCGDIYYTNAQGVATGGYRLDNGAVTALLIPHNRPRAELEADEIAWHIYGDVYTVSGNRGGGGPSFGGFNAVMYGNYPSFMDNTFGFFDINSGGGTNNSSMNGSTAPIVDATHPLCASSFEFTPKTTIRANPDGTRYTTTDNSIYSCGFSNISVSITFVKRATGEEVTKLVTLGNLFITMPGVGGSSAELGDYAAQAFSVARTQTETAMGVNNGGNPSLIFSTKLFDELRRLEGLFLAGHHSPNLSNSVLCNASAAQDKMINYGTKFNTNYTTCP